MPNPEHPFNESSRTIVIPISGVSLALLIGGIAVGYGLRDRWGGIPLFPANQEIKPSDKVLTSPETSQLTRALIDQYLETKRRYETIPGQQLTFDGPPLGSSAPVVLELSRLARQHLVDGLYLAKLVLPLEQASSINIEASNQKAVLFDRQFDLNNPLQFHLLAAILELELKNQQTQEVQQEANQKIIDNLLWLFDRNPATNIDKDAFPFITVSYLNFHSQIFQVLEQSGLPWPRQVNYIRYFEGAPGAAWYNTHASRNSFTIDITNYSGDISVIHEVGHFMADAVHLDPNNQRLREISQDEYNKQIRAVLGNNPDEPDEKTLVEGYAESFGDFFLQGQVLRERMRRWDPEAAQVLKIQYQFMKMVFGGKEFTKDGKLLTFMTEYKIGVQVAIPDDSDNRLGILLRRYLYSYVDPELPAVFPRDRVEIIGGPVLAYRIGGWESESYWRVRIIGQDPTSVNLLGDLFGSEGWMPESLLGEIIQQRR